MGVAYCILDPYNFCLELQMEPLVALQRFKKTHTSMFLINKQQVEETERRKKIIEHRGFCICEDMYCTFFPIYMCNNWKGDF